jgi:hypothetical protein
MALTKLNEMIDSMNALPEASDGFGARAFYDTAKNFGVTCKEVYDNLLVKEHKLARGKYLAKMPSNPTSSAVKNKTARVAAVPRKSAPKRAASTDISKMLIAPVPMEAAAKNARFELIAKIARRHNDEDAFIKSLSI